MKKRYISLLCVILAAALLSFPLIPRGNDAFAEESGVDGVAGDIDKSGKIDTTDYILLKRHVLNVSLLEGDSLFAADLDKNGVIDTTDCIILKKLILSVSGVQTEDNGLKVYGVYVLPPDDYSGEDTLPDQTSFIEETTETTLPYYDTTSEQYGETTETVILFPDLDKTVTIGGKEFTLHYLYIWSAGIYNKADYASYCDLENGISANYYPGEDKPWYITFGNKKLVKVSDESIDSAEKAMEAAAAFLAGESLSVEKYTVKVSESDFNGLEWAVDYFYMIDGLQTNDHIRVTVDRDGYLKLFYYTNIGMFDGISEGSIDFEKCDKLASDRADEFCAEYRSEFADKYRGCKFNKSIVIVKGYCCVSYRVTPVYETSSIEEAAQTNFAFSLLIPVFAF